MSPASRRLLSVLTGALVAALVVACGGPVPETGSPVTPSPTSSAVAPTPVSTDGPAASPPPSVVVSERACSLLNVEAVETAVGVAGLTARPEPGDVNSGICSYAAGDRIVAQTSLGLTGAQATLDVHAGESVPVPGLGDAAIWVDSIDTLYVRVGDSAVGIKLLAAVVAPDTIQAKAMTLARAAIARLP